VISPLSASFSKSGKAAHPAECKRRRIAQTEALADFQAHFAREFRGFARTLADEQDRIRRFSDIVSARSAATVESPRNFTIGPFAPSAASVMYARPFAPCDFATFGQRVEVAPRERRRRPDSAARSPGCLGFGKRVKELKSLPRKSSATSMSSRPSASRACRCP